MEHAIVWIPNGFDPRNPERTDMYSQNCLHMALQKYRALKSDGRHVLFVLLNSVVQNVSGTNLADVMQSEAREAGVCTQDIYISLLETTGSPTDALAVAEFAKARPNTLVDVFATSQETAAYFTVMYTAVARWLEDYEPTNLFFCAPNAKLSLCSRMLYKTLRIATIITALTKPSFLLWYRFLDRYYQKRRIRFTRTIH